MLIDGADRHLSMVSDIFDSDRMPLDRLHLLGGTKESLAITQDIGSFTPLIWGDGLLGSGWHTQILGLRWRP